MISFNQELNIAVIALEFVLVILFEFVMFCTSCRKLFSHVDDKNENALCFYGFFSRVVGDHKRLLLVVGVQ